MYRPFILSKFYFANPELYNGTVSIEANRNEVGRVLANFITGDGVIDGDKLSGDWFPQIKADVFISHSHRDEQFAIQLANYLKINFGLTSFIDSCVWGYADNLLKTLDDKYCYVKERNSYDYSLRNGSTAHVHMMLATALSKMMDRTECVFFVNTPNSISNAEVTTGGNTSSAWIYYEMSAVRTLRQNYPRSQPAYFSGASVEKKAVLYETLKVNYHVSFKGIPLLGGPEMNKWEAMCGVRQNEHSLDVLYSLIKEGNIHE